MYNPDYDGIKKNEGWICPRCGQVMAPWMPYCNCQPLNVNVTTIGTDLTCFGRPVKKEDWSTTFGRAEDFESYLTELYYSLFKKDRNEDSDETDL